LICGITPISGSPQRLDVEGTLHAVVDERDEEGKRQAKAQATDHAQNQFSVTLGAIACFRRGHGRDPRGGALA